jgi:hypothetical protein
MNATKSAKMVTTAATKLNCYLEMKDDGSVAKVAWDSTPEE